jgi:hypothetical protein
MRNVRFVFLAYLITVVLGIGYVTVLGLIGR